MGKSIYLGRATATKRLLKGSLMLQGWERAGRDRWVAQSTGRTVAAEVEGDPVRRVSLVLPTRPGAGMILGQFINEFMPQAEASRTWAEGVLRGWGDRIKADGDTVGLEESHTAEGRTLRLQSLGVLAITATITV